MVNVRETKWRERNVKEIGTGGRAKESREREEGEKAKNGKEKFK